MPKIYLESEILKKQNKETRVIISNIDHLIYALRFTPNWSINKELNFRVDHIEFYALSLGWDKFTDSGYKSHFFHPEIEDNLTDDDIKEFFKEFLKVSNFEVENNLQTDIFDAF